MFKHESTAMATRQQEVVASPVHEPSATDNDDTLHRRIFQRVCLENLIQLGLQTSLIGLRFGIMSKWALAQVACSVVVGLATAISKTTSLVSGASVCSLMVGVASFPLELIKLLLWERAALEFWDPVGQRV